jgi:hypothetical protein
MRPHLFTLTFIGFLAFVCGTPAMATTVTIHDGNAYFLTSAVGSWSAAEAEAVADGGHLASVHSASDNQFLVDTFLSGANATAIDWIGLVDPQQGDGAGAQHAGDFVWTDGTPVNYTNWNVDTGEPNNYDDQEYWTALNWHYAATGSGMIGTWNDMPEFGSDSYSVAANGPYYGIVEVAVPEPATIAVFCLAMLGLAAARHRTAATALSVACRRGLCASSGRNRRRRDPRVVASDRAWAA